MKEISGIVDAVESGREYFSFDRALPVKSLRLHIDYGLEATEEGRRESEPRIDVDLAGGVIRGYRELWEARQSGAEFIPCRVIVRSDALAGEAEPERGAWGPTSALAPPDDEAKMGRRRLLWSMLRGHGEKYSSVIFES